MLFDNIPHEMRLFNQWVCWRYEDRDSPKPTKVPYSPKTQHLASVTDSQTWATYDEAIFALGNAKLGYTGIGFVLTTDDPYAFIDLDDTGGDSASNERQAKIFEAFDSYAERSPSGKGLHIIIRGSLEQGRRRSHIEVYSSLRYMTMTGDVYRKSDIKDYDEQLKMLSSEMSAGSVATKVYAGLAEVKDNDEVVFDRARSAANGEKFDDLFKGHWDKHYPSQSEADFALINIFAFYTQNREQIARMFRYSKLGVRPKAQRQDYLNWMINKSFDRILDPIDFDQLHNIMAEAQAQRAKKLPIVLAEDAPRIENLTVPPGLVGEIAQFIYAQAPRPVPEIALAGALGLISGICGRAYNISSAGLNQYVLLLAPTGTGKEAIASGINKLMREVIKEVPAAKDFIGPGEIASNVALIKYMSKTANCFISLVGEFGLYLKQMGSEGAAPHMVGLRRLLLDLYNKSGEGQVVQPYIASNRENNTISISAPAFTMVGESTPETFYEALDEGMILSGLLPRFTIIEYRGKRPEMNEAHASVQPDDGLVKRLGSLAAYSCLLNSQSMVRHIEQDEHATIILKKYNIYCDEQINNNDREIRKHLWNRAHMKVLKLAGVIAIGCNAENPVITAQHANWAIDLVNRDVRNMMTKFDAGEIGTDNEETRQIAKLIHFIREYVLAPWSEVEGYTPEFGVLHAEKILTYSYVQRRCVCLKVFKGDRMGATTAIKRSLNTLIERGDIQQISKPDLERKFGKKCVAYAILNPKVFGL